MTTPLILNETTRKSEADQGFYRTFNVLFGDIHTAANPPARLTGATAPTWVFTSNEEYINWTSTTGVILTSFVVPEEAAWGIYTPSGGTPARTLSIIFGMHLLRSGTSDTITFGGSGSDTVLYARSPGGALKGAYKPPLVTLATSEGGTNPVLKELDFSGQLASGLAVQPGDKITLQWNPNQASLTDNLRMYGAYWRIRVNHTATDESRR